MSTLRPAMGDLTPEQRRALLAQLLREQAQATVERLPLSYGQQALYFTQQLAPESAALNVGSAFRLRGRIDEAALRRAFQALIDRHAALRTHFELTEAGPVQVVAGSAALDFTRIDAAGWTDAALVQQVEAAYEQPFDLAHSPLMRVCLFARSESEHVLLLTVHHIVFDGWSAGIIGQDLAKLYAAETGGPPAHLAPVKHPYADFVAWQRSMLAGPEGERLRAYWHAQLAGELPVIDLPIDKPRPALQNMRGRAWTLDIDPSLAHDLRSLAKAEHATLYTLFLAAFYVLLHRITGQEDLIVGSPMAARGREAFQQTVGYLVSPVPLRVQMRGDMTLRDALAHVRRTLFDAIAHEDYPFPLLVEELQPKRNPGRTPLMELLFTHVKYQALGISAHHAPGSNAPESSAPERATGGVVLDSETFPLSQENGQFDLSLRLIEQGDTLTCDLSYNTDLFEEATAARMAGHLQTLLVEFVRDLTQTVGGVPMLSPGEREQLLVEWNATAAAYPANLCMHDLPAAQAVRTPEAVAVRSAADTLTYAELDRRSNQLAWHLRERGVRPGVLVGLLLDRTPMMLTALLAVLKAGGAYVPLDPSFPVERLAMMLEDSRAPLLLAQESLTHLLPDGEAQVLLCDAEWPQIARHPETAPPALATPDDLAYVIFTSGSTGRPKGVQVPHRAVVNLLHSVQREPGLAPSDVLAAVTTLSFDISVPELLLPLAVGAQVVLASRRAASDGEELAQLLEESGATVMDATPVTWRLLLAAEWQPPAGFRAWCTGEALPPALAQELLERGVELWNLYGPTETTVWSTLQRITSAAPPIPIGRPVANTRLYILNASLQPAPVGVVGDLYIGGDGLARGYLDRPDLTAERFVANPFGSPGERMYKTGDLARYRPDGTVELLGRTDHQVKIRGFRIELGEIEAALARLPAVAEAVVVAREDGRGGLRLVAYLVPEEDEAPSAGELRLSLRSTLPDYMLPAAFVPLKALPRTPNGKIDRRALPAPEPAAARTDAGYQAPSSPTEQAVAEVWREVLQVERVGVYDNFFDLGGHSLLAVEAIAKLGVRLGVKIGPAAMRLQSLGQLAATYDGLLNAAAPAETSDAHAPSPPQEAQGLAGRLVGAMRRALGPTDTQ